MKANNKSTAYRSPFSYDVFRRRGRFYYIWEDEIGIYPTPTTIETVRVHYTYKPTEMSNDGDTVTIDEQYEKAVVYGACVELARRLRGRDIEKYGVLARELTSEYLREKDKAMTYGIEKDGEKFVKVGYKDF